MPAPLTGLISCIYKHGKVTETLFGYWIPAMIERCICGRKADSGGSNTRWDEFEAILWLPFVSDNDSRDTKVL